MSRPGCTPPRAHLVRADHVSHVDLDEEVLLWTGVELHLLAGGAATVWHQLDGVTTAVDVTAAAAQTAGTDPATVEADVLEVLERLQRAGLVIIELQTPGPRWTVPVDVGWVRDKQTVVLTRHGSGIRQTLTSTAARIFELAGAGLGLAEVVDALAAEFPDAPADLDDVVLTLLGQLEEAGYLFRTSRS